MDSDQIRGKRPGHILDALPHIPPVLRHIEDYLCRARKSEWGIKLRCQAYGLRDRHGCIRQPIACIAAALRDSRGGSAWNRKRKRNTYGDDGANGDDTSSDSEKQSGMEDCSKRAYF